MTFLILCQNNLQGFIPEFIGDLSNLEELNIWGNNFTGSIPHKLGTNGLLTYLDVSSNKLSGPIPERLGSCELLDFLNLTDNQLTGQLPVNIEKLTNLRYLLVANNNLIGKITPQITGTLIFSNAYLNCIFQNSSPLHTLRLPTVKLLFSFLNSLVTNKNIFLVLLRFFIFAFLFYNID